MSIKGYKVFSPNWTCKNNFKYEVGKTYKHEGNIELYGSGFHFCKKASDCFNYYSFNSNNKVAEVEAIGLVECGKSKSVTDEIKIIREIKWEELLTIVNEGKNCTGLCNTGNWNTGNWNTGDRNTGDWNTGDRNTGLCNTGLCNTGNWNTGDRNTGDWNTGDRNTGLCNTGNWNTGNWNTGHYNTGDWNTGYYNTGDYNTGDWNTGNCNTGNRNTGDWNTGNRNTGNCNTGSWNATNYSTGLFNTKQENIRIFNKPSNWTLRDWLNSDVRRILNLNLKNSVWIYEENMTDEEKEKYPDYKTTGGYLKVFEFKESCKNMWNNLTAEEKEKVITELPNFDKDIFKEITGINVEEE